MTIARLPAWPTILHDAHEAARRAAFAWGVHDCCLWPVHTIDAMCATDLSSRFVYATEAEAFEVMERVAVRGSTPLLDRVIERITTELGFPEVKVLQAQRGDVVVADLGGGPTMGLVIGASAGFVAPRGLLELPLRKCRRAWAVAR